MNTYKDSMYVCMCVLIFLLLVLFCLLSSLQLLVVALIIMVAVQGFVSHCPIAKIQTVSVLIIVAAVQLVLDLIQIIEPAIQVIIISLYMCM